MRTLVFQEPEITVSLSDAWKQLQVSPIVPFLYFALLACVLMFVMLITGCLNMKAAILYVKALGKMIYSKYKLDAMGEKMKRNGEHPKVLIQIHIYNVYKLSIGAVCALSWPPGQFIVQVLDDANNNTLMRNVKAECNKWRNQGLNVKYENRANKNGYKEGALWEGIQKQYVNDCEYVVIIDANIQPEKDFLKKTIPYLIDNKELGMVQARWKFVNADECLMTRLQETSHNYHFFVEQQIGSSTCEMFRFNGTACVWRIQAIRDSGRWEEQTTVEDMDFAVRASLQGCKFVFVGDVLKTNYQEPSRLIDSSSTAGHAVQLT